MLTKLPNGAWLDPQKVTLIQHLPESIPTVEIRMTDEVGTFQFATFKEAAQFVESVGEIVNRALNKIQYPTLDFSSKESSSNAEF